VGQAPGHTDLCIRCAAFVDRNRVPASAG
jgi:hypothetical protein